MNFVYKFKVLFMLWANWNTGNRNIKISSNFYMDGDSDTKVQAINMFKMFAHGYWRIVNSHLWIFDFFLILSLCIHWIVQRLYILYRLIFTTQGHKIVLYKVYIVLSYQFMTVYTRLHLCLLHCILRCAYFKYWSRQILNGCLKNVRKKISYLILSWVGSVTLFRFLK